MTATDVYFMIEDKVTLLKHTERAELAALILNDADPSIDVLEKLFETLDDNQHDELITRASERKSRS